MRSQKQGFHYKVGAEHVIYLLLLRLPFDCICIFYYLVQALKKDLARGLNDEFTALGCGTKKEVMGMISSCFNMD